VGRDGTGELGIAMQARKKKKKKKEGGGFSSISFLATILEGLTKSNDEGADSGAEGVFT